jgi:hypothetical protein
MIWDFSTKFANNDDARWYENVSIKLYKNHRQWSFKTIQKKNCIKFTRSCKMIWDDVNNHRTCKLWPCKMIWKKDANKTAKFASDSTIRCQWNFT